MQGTDVLGVALRLSLAVAFAVFGWEKMRGGEWTGLFRQIGLGDWLRYLTAVMQMTGAALLLVPRTARAGAGLIGLTMAGAIGAHLFILPTGVGGAIIPAAFLGFAVAAGWRKTTATEEPVSLR
jgi:putative oxidoreductase